jgi:hypothetical protein
MLLVTGAFAYIPHANFILESAGSFRGEGVYSLEQEVRFTLGEQTVSVREFWLVEGMNFMRLRIEGQGELKDKIRGTWIYQRGKKYFRNESGALSVDKVSPDSIESFFQFRNGADGERLLAAARIVSAADFASAATSRTKIVDVNKVDYSPPRFLRLARSGGATAYAFGLPTPVGSATPLPGAWIEQDRFFLRRLRTASQVDVRADQYTLFEKNLWFPQVRSVRWSGGTATILVIAAKSVPKSETIRARLQPGSLNDPREKEPERMNVKLPDLEPIREFYSRLR